MPTDNIKTVVTRVNVVQQRRLRIGLAVLVLVAGAGVYVLGYQHGFDDRVPLVLDEAGLKDTISKLETRRAVDSEAINRLRAELAGSERQVDDLEKELVFYRDIMGSSDDLSSVKVRQPELIWHPERRELEYRAVIQRLAQGSQFYRGDLTIHLIDEAGSPILLPELTASHDIAFKYFQRISGTIRLPDSVIPVAVRFGIELSAPRKWTHEQTFDWTTSVVYSAK